MNGTSASTYGEAWKNSPGRAEAKGRVIRHGANLASYYLLVQNHTMTVLWSFLHSRISLFGVRGPSGARSSFALRVAATSTPQQSSRRTCHEIAWTKQTCLARDEVVACQQAAYCWQRAVYV